MSARKLLHASLLLSAAVLAPAIISALSAEECVEYAEGGKIFRRYSIDKEGNLDGRYIENHPNGKIHIRAFYKKGRLDGKYEVFDERGKRIRTSIYAGGILLYPMLPAEVEAVIRSLRPVPSGKMFDEPPRLIPPFRAGRLSASYLTAGLQQIKCYRFLCGLAYDDLGIKDEYVDLAQHAAVLLQVLGRLDHHPPRPPAMSEEFYRKAALGAARSNLHGSSRSVARGPRGPLPGAGGRAPLIGAVDSFMFDSDPGNIDRLGHRRWILNPAMKYTGFGQAGGFVVQYSMDHSRRNPPDYDFIPFPPRGYIPGRYITPRHAWNISLNPTKYAIANDKTVKVKVLQVDKKLRPVSRPLNFDFFNVNRAPYGVPLCIIFRPVFKKGFGGRRFRVTVKGVRKIDPEAGDLEYLVEIGR